MKVELVNDENLRNISGGAHVLLSARHEGLYSFTVSQNEFDKLKSEGYLDDDGKLHYRNVGNAIRCLKDNGFEMTYGISLKKESITTDELNQMFEKFRKENPPVHLVIEK